MKFTNLLGEIASLVVEVLSELGAFTLFCVLFAIVLLTIPIWIYRKIVKVENDTLYLDNGIELEIWPNEGCEGCSSGWYYLTELNDCDNAITNVEFICENSEDSEYETSYKIFVFAENKTIKILQVDGSDGNGYYGSGYSIIVREKGGEG